MTEPAHSWAGGSVATRILRCPGSVALIAKVPPELIKGSAYADRGVALHAVMAELLHENEPYFPEHFLGKTIDGYTVTDNDIELFVRPAYAFGTKLIEKPGAIYCLEKRVAFPTIDGAFGTCDLLVRIDRTAHVVDWKSGTGVRVLALYPDGDTDVINGQLLFYAAAARHSLPQFFDGVDKIVLTIVQPVTSDLDDNPVSSVEVTHAELDEFIVVYRAACAEALSPSPRLEKGAHCQFCPARPVCPQHTRPLLDLAQFELPKIGATAAMFGAAPPKQEYLKILANGLELLDAVKDLSVALRDQAKAALQNGDAVPGFALSCGRAERHWRDDEPATIAALTALGLSRSDVIAEELRSVKQTELRARARKIKIPPELIISRRGGTSLMRSENVHAPAPGRSEIARSFAEALAAYDGGESEK